MPEFSCKHTITIAAKPHPKSACQLQRSLGSATEDAAPEPRGKENQGDDHGEDEKPAACHEIRIRTGDELWRVSRQPPHADSANEPNPR